MEKSTEFVRHVFTEEEKKEIASELAQKVTELQTHEDQKKAVMSDLKRARLTEHRQKSTTSP